MYPLATNFSRCPRSAIRDPRSQIPDPRSQIERHLCIPLLLNYKSPLPSSEFIVSPIGPFNLSFKEHE